MKYSGGSPGGAAYTGGAAPAAGSVVFSDGTSLTGDNANLYWDDTNDLLIVGPRGSGTYTGRYVAVETGSATQRGFVSSQASADTSGARFVGRKSRGTSSAPATVVTGDVLSNFVALGHDGTAYLEMGNAGFRATGTIGTNRVPTKYVIATATDAATSVLTDRVHVDTDGSLVVGLAVSSTSLAIGGATIYAGPSQKGLVVQANATTPDNIVRFQDVLGTSYLKAEFSAGVGALWSSVTPSVNTLFASYNAGPWGYIGTATNHPLKVQTNSTYRWNWSAAGHFLAETHNTYDIGTSSAALAPRNVYAGTSFTVGATVLTAASLVNGGGGLTLGASTDNSVLLFSNGAEKWRINATSFEFRPAGNNTQDLGATLQQIKSFYYGTSIFANGVKVLGLQGAAVADAAGGAVIDSQARTAINDLLARIRAHGLIA